MEATSAAAEFQLDTSVPDDRRGMAAFYGVEPITITRWKNAGREAKDPCPLKMPGHIPDWYRRVFPKKLVPDAVLAALAKVTPPAPGGAEQKRIGFRDEPGEEGGLLARLKSDEERLHRRYRDAMVGELDDSTIRQYREHWQEAADMLDMHKSRAKKRGEMADPAEYDSAFERIIAPLPDTLFRSFPKEPPLAESWAETVREAIREALRRLPGTIEEMLAA